MIPDFKTYIKESIWSDIQDRSAGDTIRKEDDIDLLDRDEFFDNCIRPHYIETTTEHTILNWNPSKCIIIPVATHLYKSPSHIDLTYQYNVNKPEKYLHITPNVKSEPELFKLLKDRYILKKVVVGYNITPKDSIKDDVPNSFVIDVLNYIIDTPCDTFKKLIDKI